MYKNIAKKKKHFLFDKVKCVLRVFKKKHQVIYLGDKVERSSIVLSNHVGASGPTYVINSVEELNEYVSGTYNNFDTAIEKYDEEYFKTSALVIAEITKNTGSAKLTLKSIVFNEDTMVIKFKTKTPNIVTCDMAYWHIIVECTQEEVNSINSIKVYDSGNLVEGRV